MKKTTPLLIGAFAVAGFVLWLMMKRTPSTASATVADMSGLPYNYYPQQNGPIQMSASGIPALVRPSSSVAPMNITVNSAAGNTAGGVNSIYSNGGCNSCGTSGSGNTGALMAFSNMLQAIKPTKLIDYVNNGVPRIPVIAPAAPSGNYASNFYQGNVSLRPMAYNNQLAATGQGYLGSVGAYNPFNSATPQAY
jgi:hypothetical protein